MAHGQETICRAESEMEMMEQTREEFLVQYEQRHPRPVARGLDDPRLPEDPLPQRAGRMPRFWVIIIPIAMLVVVSVFRVQGAFYDIAHKNLFIGWLETASLESILAALGFDLAIVGLMAERVQRQRRHQPEGNIKWGLALALVVTGFTNFQQGVKVYAVNVQTAWDVVSLGVAGLFVFALSAGVPILAALLASVLGAFMADVDAENRAARADFESECVRVRAEHTQAAEKADTDFADALARWQQNADGQWTRTLNRSAVSPVRPRLEAPTDSRSEQVSAQPVVPEEGVAQTDGPSNRNLTNEMILRLYTEQPGCSLAEGAHWLIAEYTLANEQEKLRQVLRRRATALVGHGLRVDENGKFFIEHNIGRAEAVE